MKEDELLKRGKLSIKNEENLSIKIDGQEIPLERLISVNLEMKAPNQNHLTLNYAISDVDIDGVDLKRTVRLNKE